MFDHIILSSVWVAEKATNLVGHMVSLYLTIYDFRYFPFWF